VTQEAGMTDAAADTRLELIEESDMTPEQDADIKRLLCECFPDDAAAFSQSRHWHGSGPLYSLVYREGERLVGHVGIVVRTILVGSTPIEMAGIQSLAVSPASQGSMLAWALMRRGMREAKRRGIAFGVLFCVPTLERLYAAMKWRRIDVGVTMRNEQGESVPIPGKNIAMVLEMTDRPFPDGDIDLQAADW
jgi:predicted N-acetyltransferase YhbS